MLVFYLQNYNSEMALTVSKNAAYMLLTSSDHLYSQQLNRILVSERLQMY